MRRETSTGQLQAGVFQVSWLNRIFPIHREWDAMSIDAAVSFNLRGTDIQDFVIHTLKPLRDNVSHALAEASGELTVSADDLLDIDHINRYLPTAKCIARRMLKNDFPSEFLSYLPEK